MADWIIVVDDDTSNLKVAGHILSKAGMRVTALKSGKLALDYIRKSGFPDLILLDVNMPEMDGFETLKLLKEEMTPGNEVPVVFLTAEDGQEQETRGLESGAMDYIKKPFDPEVLLSDYSMVFQDVVLFDDTVMENIRLGKYGATDEEVLAAAKAANCDEFVDKLPNGYATPIGENGAKLSGGERQRISIARALLKNAPIVLLDEATASLDVENETKVQGALSRLLTGKTVLVIAHRMRTVEAADKIVVLADGKVAEEGSPAELLKKEDGLFRRMTRLQTAGAEWSI